MARARKRREWQPDILVYLGRHFDVDITAKPGTLRGGIQVWLDRISDNPGASNLLGWDSGYHHR